MQYSIIQTSNLDNIVFRLDAEYYHPSHINLEKKLNRLPRVSIHDACGTCDCSAFYPSIVPYYNFEGTGIPFLRVNEIQNGLLNLTGDTAFLPKKILDENKTTIAKCCSGDLIIAKGGNSLAKVALLTEAFKTYSVCRDVIVLRTQELSKINRYYLWMFLHSTIGQQLLLRTASQTGQPHLTLEAIKQIKIPLFSDSFQNNFDWLYKESQRLKSESESKYKEAQCLLLSELGLTNWKPKHKLSFIKNYSDAEQAERIDAEYYQPKYDEIKHYLSKKSKGYIKDFFQIIGGKNVTYTDSGEIGVIKTKQVLNAHLAYNVESRVKKECVDNIKAPILQNLDVVFASMGVGSLGKSALYYAADSSKSFTIDSTLKILRCKPGKGYSPEVLQIFLKCLVGQELIYQNIVGSSGIINIYEDYIYKIPLPDINPKLQTKIQKQVTDSHSLRKKSKRLLKHANQTIEMAIEQDEETATNWLKSQIF
ncbi:MAG: restriction endonuclease subunit S [Bacteroidetes bacterium]|nr:restriction endonuclease subunit S [Bacteroidota bacterium]